MQPTIEKPCMKCGKIQSFDQFYKTLRYGRDYWLPSCKECHRAMVAVYRKTLEGKAAQRRADVVRRGRHPLQMRARNAVNHEVLMSRLLRPDALVCAYCTEPAVEYHHHNGYAPEHSLDVVAVCRPCHLKQD